MPHEENFVNTIPVGKLGIIAHKSSQALGEKVDQYIVNWRNKRENEAGSAIHFKDYRKDSDNQQLEPVRVSNNIVP